MLDCIAITPEHWLPYESEAITALLSAGFSRVHIRKPRATETKFRRLIESVDSVFYDRLTLHDFHPLAIEYGLGGVHLNSRCACVPAGFSGLTSRSCHSIAEAIADHGSDYLFISPIFDSISKAGYAAKYDPCELSAALRGALKGCKVYALGGVCVERFGELKEMGFYGAVMLGCIWRQDGIDDVCRLAERIIKSR